MALEKILFFISQFKEEVSMNCSGSRVRMEIIFYRFLMIRSISPNFFVMNLVAVTHVCAVFSHGSFIRLIKPDFPQVLFDMCLNGKPGLFAVDTLLVLVYFKQKSTSHKH
jgi:hypothetical protein